MRRISIIFGIIAGLALLNVAHAQSEQEPLELTADRAEMNNVTGVGVYTGNVVLTRGDITITGDRMTVHTTEQRELDRVVITGRKASFERRQPQDEPVRGQAPRMEYHAGGQERIVLTGGATVWEGKNRFSGQIIEYDVEGDRVVARGAESEEDGERVRITIFPRQGDGR